MGEIDWVALREKQKQIEEDVNKIKEQQKQEAIKKYTKPTQTTPISDDKPIFRSKSYHVDKPITYIKDTSGQVVGIQDPYSQQSYAIKPTTVEKVDEKVQEAFARADYSGKVETPKPEQPKFENKQVIKVTGQEAYLGRVKSTGIGTWQNQAKVEYDYDPRADRIEALVSRERLIENISTGLKERVGIAKKDDRISVKNIGKTLAGLPIDIPTQAAIIGGRVAYAADIATTPKGKQELWTAFKETPKAVAQSYDPTTASGLVNIGLTAFGVYKIGKARAISRAKPSFTVEESVGKRVTTKGLVIDETYIDVKTSVGKKVIEVKGRGTNTFTEVGKGRVTLRGTAELTELPSKKVYKIETGGLGTETQGGFDVSLISKVTGKGKTKYYKSVTQSAELIKEPTQVIKSMTTTQEFMPKTGEFKPKSVSTSVTGELYMEDLFKTTGESSFRKTIKGESGRTIAIEQTLATDTFKVSAEQFSKQFEGISRKPDISRTIAERKYFDTAVSESTKAKTVVKPNTKINKIADIWKKGAEESFLSESKAQPKIKIKETKGVSKYIRNFDDIFKSTETKQQAFMQETYQPTKQVAITESVQKNVQLTGISTQQGALVNIAKTQAQAAATQLKTSMVLKGATTGTFAVSAYAPTKTAQTFTITQQQAQKPAIDLRTIIKPTSLGMTQISSKPVMDIRTEPMLETRTEPLIKTRPAIKEKPVIDIRQDVVTTPRIKQEPMLETRFDMNPRLIKPILDIEPFEPIPPEPIIPFGGFAFKGFSFGESRGKKTKVNRKAYTLQTPSVESVVYNIRSKTYSKVQAQTGLGTRPIKI